jgi:hypothetical protein
MDEAVWYTPACTPAVIVTVSEPPLLKFWTTYMPWPFQKPFPTDLQQRNRFWIGPMCLIARLGSL